MASYNSYSSHCSTSSTLKDDSRPDECKELEGEAGPDDRLGSSDNTVSVPLTGHHEQRHWGQHPPQQSDTSEDAQQSRDVTQDKSSEDQSEEESLTSPSYKPRSPSLTLPRRNTRDLLHDYVQGREQTRAQHQTTEQHFARKRRRGSSTPDGPRLKAPRLGYTPVSPEIETSPPKPAPRSQHPPPSSAPPLIDPPVVGEYGPLVTSPESYHPEPAPAGAVNYPTPPSPPRESLALRQARQAHEEYIRISWDVQWQISDLVQRTRLLPPMPYVHLNFGGMAPVMHYNEGWREMYGERWR